jgi:hypothetical protein
MSRPSDAARARRRARARATAGGAPPPLAFMTCRGCGTADVNEDWLVLTREPGTVSAGDIGICPRCCMEILGPKVISDPAVRAKALGSIGQ